MIADSLPAAWTPQYTLTPAIIHGMMQIEATRALVDLTLLPLLAEAGLRAQARVRARACGRSETTCGRRPSY